MDYPDRPFPLCKTDIVSVLQGLLTSDSSVLTLHAQHYVRVLLSLHHLDDNRHHIKIGHLQGYDSGSIFSMDVEKETGKG